MSSISAPATVIDHRARARARRCAVQALYQWQLAGQDPADILNEFIAEREVVHVDLDYFRLLAREIPAHAIELEQDLLPVLNRPWRELDPVERAILLIGAYEFHFCPEVPWRVVINEAIELEKMFGAEQGHRYINTTLDKLAHQLRPQEIAAS
ncbi:MAG TPA: transcription antitermination factor NusB [Gammaproteobacteria bacterium]|nr:transcription antitermination factor NusB [Gammaproteobacteria bacterium]